MYWLNISLLINQMNYNSYAFNINLQAQKSALDKSHFISLLYERKIEIQLDLKLPPGGAM